MSRARLIRARTLSLAVWCSVIPSVQHNWAVGAVAYAMATSRMASAGTPVICSARARSYSETFSA